jgi:hypothetical protein
MTRCELTNNHQRKQSQRRKLRGGAPMLNSAAKQRTSCAV